MHIARSRFVKLLPKISDPRHPAAPEPSDGAPWDISFATQGITSPDQAARRLVQLLVSARPQQRALARKFARFNRLLAQQQLVPPLPWHMRLRRQVRRACLPLHGTENQLMAGYAELLYNGAWAANHYYGGDAEEFGLLDRRQAVRHIPTHTLLSACTALNAMRQYFMNIEFDEALDLLPPQQPGFGIHAVAWHSEEGRSRYALMLRWYHRTTPASGTLRCIPLLWVEHQKRRTTLLVPEDNPVPRTAQT